MDLVKSHLLKDLESLGCHFDLEFAKPKANITINTDKNIGAETFILHFIAIRNGHGQGFCGEVQQLRPRQHAMVAVQVAAADASLEPQRPNPA